MKLVEKWEVRLEWQSGDVELLTAKNEQEAARLAKDYDGISGLESATACRFRHYLFREKSALPSDILIGESAE
tara:strand:+ start:1132 stop:1350 length:219 start_codon:yes stop_codon:yes gene_type:complete